MAGANFSTIEMAENMIFLPISGNLGLLAIDSVALRSSWNIFLLYGFRRDEYLNDKKW